MTFSNAQKEKLLEISQGEVLFDEPMAAYSTMKIGGPADALIRPRDTQKLKEVMGYAISNEMPYMFWGAGSDILVRDKGMRGLIIQLSQGFNDLTISGENADEIFVAAGAGLQTAALVRFTSDNGLKGTEWLAGIPGTIGGNVLTNAGTPEGSIADVIEEIGIVDRGLKELTVKRKALEFSYRSLKLPRSTAVVRAVLKLKRDDASQVKERINQIMVKRKTTQPYDAPTLGCIFKNPKEGRAGILIDEAGLKGVRVGKARVSELHANFIVNEDGAAARDVEILIGLIRERVKQKFGVVLETEIRIIGET